MHHIVTIAALCTLLSSCVIHNETKYAYPRNTATTKPVLPRNYPYYDPEADNPPPQYRNNSARRPAANYYQKKYPYYNPEADNPPYQQQRDPNAPHDGFVRPMFK